MFNSTAIWQDVLGGELSVTSISGFTGLKMLWRLMSSASSNFLLGVFGLPCALGLAIHVTTLSGLLGVVDMGASSFLGS